MKEYEEGFYPVMYNNLIEFAYYQAGIFTILSTAFGINGEYLPADLTKIGEKLVISWGE